MSSHGKNVHSEGTEGQHQPGSSNSSGPPETSNTQEESSLAEWIALSTTMSAAYNQPMESLRVMGKELFCRLSGSGFRPERDIGAQAGRVILVTGGNTGLGKETILQLAKHRPERIYLAARDETKGKNAIASLQESLEGLSVDIRYLPLDLASFKSIRAAAVKFTSECDRLDTLILNAGVMAQPFSMTEDGYEIQFGTNHVGHFLFTKLLLPTLQRTSEKDDSDVRIISVSSMAWQMAPTRMSKALSLMTSVDKQKEANRWTKYGISKAANILFAAELARRFPRFTAVSIHPGIIFTGLYDACRQMNPVIRYGLMAANPFVIGEEAGALNHLWAAGAEKNKLVNGEYYTPIGVKGWNNPFAHDVEAGRKLWEWTDDQVRGSK